MDGIRFGTSGWRAVIAEGFTVEAVRRVSSAIGARLAESGRPCLVAHDARFGGARFAAEACRALAARGVTPLLCRGVTPTPAAALAVVDGGLAGGIVITASHNAPEYSGIKWITADGASPAPALTRDLEARIAALDPRTVPLAEVDPEPIDPARAYLRSLDRLIDRTLLRRKRPRILYDALHGAGSGFLDRHLERAGCRLETLHGAPDPLFGGRAPDPTAETLAGLAKAVRARGARLGLATDGDADRYGVVDPEGGFVEPNDVFALLLDYLARRRGLRGEVACSVATTRMIHRVASAHGLEVRVCPIGFKHMAPLLVEGRAAVAGEESAGFALAAHLPDKDGMLAGALVAEMTAAEGSRPSTLLTRLRRRYGALYSRRIALPLTPRLVERLARLAAAPPDRLAGLRVRDVSRRDGLHLALGGDDWVHLRASGTEPVIRIYGEASSPRVLRRILRAAPALLLEGTAKRASRKGFSR